MSRLVVVSNRVPNISARSASGGLAVGIKAALEGRGGLWFGWSGETREGPATVRVEDHDAFSLATVDLSPDDHDDYYIGFSNRCLWPVLHSRLDFATFDAQHYSGYQRVNRDFARHLMGLLQPGDRIWVHDYHLIPLGRELRRAGVAAPLGFFLHTPFPAPDVFLAVPWRGDLARCLCAYDVVGFQTRRDYQNFCDYVVRELNGSVSDDGRVQALGTTLQAGVFPIGIDVDRFEALAQSAEVARLEREVAAAMPQGDTVIGVDRLDYSKGLVERFRAFELMLEAYPQFHGKVSLVQVAAPSREVVPEYLEVRSKLEALSGRVNGRFGELDWLPIKYLNKPFDQTQLTALYRRARVGFITPLHDGMNLVAKEYVAVQNPEDPGVLVLSRFAGAAESLSGALIVNPHDPSAMADTLAEALRMPQSERRMRWRRMMAAIRRYDVHRWCGDFLATLDQVGVVPARAPSARPSRPLASALPDLGLARAVPFAGVRRAEVDLERPGDL